jgi:signal peptidase II
MWLIILLIIVFLIIDIVSKLVISNLMNVYDSIIVIKNIFNITYVRNTGAAWSLFAGRTWLLIIVSLIIISFIIFYIYKNKPKNKFEMVGYSLVLGGAIGNFIDRIVYGYVIDFLDFNIFGYDYPIFNIADTFIVMGVIILCICTWRCNDGN